MKYLTHYCSPGTNKVLFQFSVKDIQIPIIATISHVPKNKKQGYLKIMCVDLKINFLNSHSSFFIFLKKVDERMGWTALITLNEELSFFYFISSPLFSFYSLFTAKHIHNNLVSPLYYHRKISSLIIVSTL